jgi:hypothetical protein
MKVFNNSSHLLKQIDIDSEDGYMDFVLNEKKLINSGIRGISNLSKRIIESIDIDNVWNIRIKNFSYLDYRLRNRNKLELPNVSAFSYPLLVDGGEDLREYLRRKKIFTSTLWEDQLKTVTNKSIEYNLIKNLVHLPIDQRYKESDMDVILKTIEEYYG